MRVRAPWRQLLKEVLSLKNTFYSCSPPTVASSLRALCAPSYCLCACARTHVCTQAHTGLCGRWSGVHKRTVCTSRSATPARPLWTLRRRGKGHYWGHGINGSRWGSYPQCRPITSSTNVLWWLQETDALHSPSVPMAKVKLPSPFRPSNLSERCIHAARPSSRFLRERGDLGATLQPHEVCFPGLGKHSSERCQD